MINDLRVKVIVGSKNPVKVGAAEDGFRLYYPECVVVGLEVESGVAAQPMSEEETVRGARQRANMALKTDANADFGIGLEGGVCEVAGKMYECAWACVVDRNGIEGLAGGLYFELPPMVAEKIRGGGELGPIMDELTGEVNVKQKLGAIGMLTKGKLDRKNAYVQIVVTAMIKFVSPEWF